jgi:hypothetical protein
LLCLGGMSLSTGLLECSVKVFYAGCDGLFLKRTVLRFRVLIGIILIVWKSIFEDSGESVQGNREIWRIFDDFFMIYFGLSYIFGRVLQSLCDGS